MAFSKYLNFKDDEEHDLILAVAKQLNVKTSVEMETIRAILFPSILCAAVFTGDFLLICHEKTDLTLNVSLLNVSLLKHDTLITLLSVRYDSRIGSK